MKDQVLALLPQFSEGELRAIIAVANNLLAAKQLNGPPPEIIETFDVMSRAASSTMPFNSFVMTKAYPSWRRNVDQLLVFVRQFPGADESKITRLAVLRLLIEILCDDLRQRGAPPTVGSIATNIHRVPACFERAFPMYRESGLLSAITNAMVKTG